MKYVMYSQNDVMSTTCPEQDAEQYFFWEPNTKTSVPDTVLLQRLMLVGCALLLFALPPPADTSAWPPSPSSGAFPGLNTSLWTKKTWRMA